MDQIQYMSIYTIVYESLSSIYEENESISIATESVFKDLKNVSSGYSDRVSKIYADINKAMYENNRIGCHKAIDELASVIDQTIEEVKNMEPDKFATFRKVAKWALAIAGLFLLIFPGTSLNIGKAILVKTPIPNFLVQLGHKVPYIFKPTGAKVTLIGMNFASQLGIAVGGFKMYSSVINQLVGMHGAGTKAEFEAKYGKNPNAAIKWYRAFFNMLQDEKNKIPELHKAANEHFDYIAKEFANNK